MTEPRLDPPPAELEPGDVAILHAEADLIESAGNVIARLLPDLAQEAIGLATAIRDHAGPLPAEKED